VRHVGERKFVRLVLRDVHRCALVQPEELHGEVWPELPQGDEATGGTLAEGTVWLPQACMEETEHVRPCGRGQWC
jgi:hypothetical protein